MKKIAYISLVVLAIMLIGSCQKHPVPVVYNGSSGGGSSSANLPTVTTYTVSNITSSSAKCGGTVTSDGGASVKACGICWNTSGSPTTSNSHTTDSISTTSFTHTMTGLTANTTYYVRAYAKNSAGTAYGAQKSFKTQSSGGGGTTPTGSIGGLFSVSATKKVYFSQGNLQYQASTNTWRFAENQYDKIGSANSNISPSYNGWIDLFGWGTGNNPTKTSNDNSNYSTFTDWGNNAISNGGNIANQWRTLSQDEWRYLCYNRNTSSGKHFAKANVNGTKGLILLPDDWLTSYYYLNNMDVVLEGDYDSNTISLSSWNSSLEANGAVFLPAAGNRNVTTVSTVSKGYYWSTSIYDTNEAIVLLFDGVYLTTMGHARYEGLSVRLVQDAN